MLPARPMQRGGWVVGCANLEFWGEVKMKMEIWVVMRIWKMSSLTELDKRNSSESVDKVKQTLAAEQLSTGRELRQQLPRKLREPQEMGEIQRPAVAGSQGKTCSHADLSRHNSRGVQGPTQVRHPIKQQAPFSKSF